MVYHLLKQKRLLGGLSVSSAAATQEEQDSNPGDLLSTLATSYLVSRVSLAYSKNVNSERKATN